ncbi:MAG: hypothetical protein JNJ54_05025 [Myxococcaceae bacterium]|nr:hypothetical protein [Myxococcaceae bacterium]
MRALYRLAERPTWRLWAIVTSVSLLLLDGCSRCPAGQVFDERTNACLDHVVGIPCAADLSRSCAARRCENSSHCSAQAGAPTECRETPSGKMCVVPFEDGGADTACIFSGSATTLERACAESHALIYTCPGGGPTCTQRRCSSDLQCTDVVACVDGLCVQRGGAPVCYDADGRWFEPACDGGVTVPTYTCPGGGPTCNVKPCANTSQCAMVATSSECIDRLCVIRYLNPLGSLESYPICLDDAGSGYAPRCDGGVGDAGTIDAGSSDAGGFDAGSSDAGAIDAGSIDAGTMDAGPIDAGTIDAGSDAGVIDAGAPDAGPGIILTFTASPTTGDAGIPVTFTWTTNNADRCSLVPSLFSVLNPNDSVTLTVAATTTFTLTCYRQSEQESRSLTVTLTPPPVSITDFSLGPSPLSLGDEVYLSWTVENASACSIMPGALDAGPPGGTITTIPSGDTTFTLTCSGRGGPVNASASVVVIPNNPPNATILAPDAGATFELGDAISLEGTCTDDLAGGPDLWPSWSTVPGQQSVGSDLVTVTRTLPVGAHTVQLQCMDTLGKTDPTPPQTSFTITAPRVASASVAFAHMCLRTVSGKIFCAGDNRQGLLGNGSTSTIAVTRPARVGIRTDWAQVVTATSVTYARAGDGTVWLWAQGAPTPVQVGTATGWTHVASSGSHRCGLRGGELWCWGSNFRSQLGITNGSLTDPTRVGTASDWTWVATSSDGTCGLRGSTAWCWGRPLGTVFSTPGSITQLQVGPAITWATVSLGADFACGLDTAGALYCWGNDAAGQLGDGVPGASSPAPVRVGMASDWVEISTGSAHACGRRGSGSLWCWGDDSYGQLGNGDAGTIATPTQVGSATDWISVNAGGPSGIGTCGVRDGGVAFCWGIDDWGQAGVGQLAPTVQVPTPILFGP